MGTFLTVNYSQTLSLFFDVTDVMVEEVVC